MIVRKQADGWKIYFHRAHALLAMKIGMALKPELWPLPDYWAEGLASITEHDDGQQSWNEKNHLNESGAPLDYREKKDCDLKQAHRVVNDAIYKSTFIALMVSQHCHELYKDITDKKVQEFLDEQTILRKQIIKHLGLDTTHLDKCYEFLRWCDELSLILCQDDVLSNHRKIEIGSVGKYGMITIHEGDSGKLVLTPWCFSADKLNLQVEYHQTNKIKYKNNQDFKEDLDIAKPLVDEFSFEMEA